VVTSAEMGPYGVRQGGYALRVIVEHGDDPIHSSGNRNELVHEPHAGYVEGQEMYFGWSTLFPDDFGATNDWQVFTQWHQESDTGGSPPLEFDVTKEKILFVLQKEGVFDETDLWQTPLVRGRWHDFVLHVKWSRDPNVGFVELWYDGAHVLPRRGARTLYSDGRTYLKQGYYRSNAVTWTGTIYHDGMVEGTSLADVQHGATPPPSDAGMQDASVHEDASVRPDASQSTDSGVDHAGGADASADGSTPSGASGEGGCAVAQGSGDLAVVNLLLGLLVAATTGARRTRRPNAP